MRFLADMGVSRLVVEWLRNMGHDAVHLRELGLQRMNDPDILAKARDERRVLLTMDLDFGYLLAVTGWMMRPPNPSWGVWRKSSTHVATRWTRGR